MKKLLMGLLVFGSVSSFASITCYVGTTENEKQCFLIVDTNHGTETLAVTTDCEHGSMINNAVFDSADLTSERNGVGKYKTVSGRENTTNMLELTRTNYYYRYWAETSVFLPNGKPDKEIECSNLEAND